MTHTPSGCRSGLTSGNSDVPLRWRNDFAPGCSVTATHKTHCAIESLLTSSMDTWFSEVGYCMNPWFGCVCVISADDRRRQPWVEGHCRVRLKECRYLKVVVVGTLGKPSVEVDIAIQFQREEILSICLTLLTLKIIFLLHVYWHSFLSSSPSVCNNIMFWTLDIVLIQAYIVQSDHT